jgi:rod shape-determining protein MreB
MSIFKEVLGIDLGTSSVIIYAQGRGIVLEEPSVVAVDENKKIMAVGNAAREMLGKTPDMVQALRPIVGGVINDYAGAEAMIKYFINKVVSKYLVMKPEIMVSVPSSISSTERRAVMEVVQRAAAKRGFIVN